jgi:DNA-binding transcriptional MocR family regulator
MHEPHLYEELAADLVGLIERGTLKHGARFPSVRRLSEQRGVSVATVVQAYALLESRGMIEARPKSGHFVRARRAEGLREPTAPRPARGPIKVAVTEDAVDLMYATMSDPSLAPLGAACVSPELLPVRKLNGILASLVREVSDLGATYDGGGARPLRQMLARRAITWGVPLGEDDFVITVGASEALYLSLRAVTKPGDTIAVESPLYFGLMQLVSDLGLRAFEVPLHPRTGLDLDALQDALRAGPVRAVLTVPSFSNPIGSLMPPEARERLVKMLARDDIPLIEDDVYGDLSFDGTRPRPAKAFDRDRVLLCGSISKTLAPGYRVGWVAGGRHHAAIGRLKLARTLSTPAAPAMAVAEMLARGSYDRHLRRLRQTLAVQVAQYREAIATHFPAGTKVSDPQGGFVLWVELPAGADSLEIQGHALERGIAIAPGPIFAVRSRYRECLRINAGFPMTDRIGSAIRALGELCERATRGELR